TCALPIYPDGVRCRVRAGRGISDRLRGRKVTSENGSGTGHELAGDSDEQAFAGSDAVGTEDTGDAGDAATSEATEPTGAAAAARTTDPGRAAAQPPEPTAAVQQDAPV